MPQKARAKFICYCNSVSQKTIEDAIRNQHCRTLDEIFDATQAGVGACGGSCRPNLQRLLDAYLEAGTFPETSRPSARPKK